MIPLSDDINTKKRPLVTYGLIILNIIVFVYELSLPDTQLRGFIGRYGLTSGNISWLTLITFNFLHGGFLHITFNMLFLWVFGNNIEDKLGHTQFIIFYLLAGAMAGLIQILAMSSNNVPVIGASGSIAAVLGAYLITFPYAKIRTLIILFFFITVVSLPAFIVITIWFIEQLFSGYLALGGTAFASGGVAYWGHIGGFISGIVFLALSKLINHLPSIGGRGA